VAGIETYSAVNKSETSKTKLLQVPQVGQSVFR